jgi:two-component sensor histidine kinase
MRMKCGSYKWIHDCGKIMERDALGKPLRLCGTHADIDEQKKAGERIKSLLAEKELILKEVHHRIKNSMNTISGLLSFHADVSKESTAAAVLQDAANRIQSVSLLYDTLYSSADYTEISVREYLPALIRQIVDSYPHRQLVKIEQAFEDFPLDAKRLQALGIIVNELITNIMKYAFKKDERGLISVSAAIVDGKVSISIQDNGAGIPESVSFENSTGFGLQLVHSLALQLHGSIRIERNVGTRLVIEFEK